MKQDGDEGNDILYIISRHNLVLHAAASKHNCLLENHVGAIISFSSDLTLKRVDSLQYQLASSVHLQADL